MTPNSTQQILDSLAEDQRLRLERISAKLERIGDLRGQAIIAVDETRRFIAKANSDLNGRLAELETQMLTLFDDAAKLEEAERQVTAGTIQMED